ncbi:hypothetical protein Tco_1255593 [Tanacetum coccineum]
MVEIGRKRSKSVKNGRSQRKSFENGQKLTKSVEICRNRSKTVKIGRKRLKSAKSVENGRKWWWLWLAEGGRGGGRQLENHVARKKVVTFNFGDNGPYGNTYNIFIVGLQTIQYNLYKLSYLPPKLYCTRGETTTASKAFTSRVAGIKRPQRPRGYAYRKAGEALHAPPPNGHSPLLASSIGPGPLGTPARRCVPAYRQPSTAAAALSTASPTVAQTKHRKVAHGLALTGPLLRETSRTRLPNSRCSPHCATAPLVPPHPPRPRGMVLDRVTARPATVRQRVLLHCPAVAARACLGSLGPSASAARGSVRSEARPTRCEEGC